MKKQWIAPKAEGEKFVANEYCNACGEMNTVYKFTCDAPKGVIHYYTEFDGTMDGVYNGSQKPINRNRQYTPCGETHEAPTSGEFYEGFVDRNGNHRCDKGEEAIIWLEPTTGWFGQKGTNGHATVNLDMKSWPTAKS